MLGQWVLTYAVEWSIKGACEKLYSHLLQIYDSLRSFLFLPAPTYTKWFVQIRKQQKLIKGWLQPFVVHFD